MRAATMKMKMTMILRNSGSLLLQSLALVLALASATAEAACPVRGSCNLEPGLADRGDLLLFQDFEASNWSSYFTRVDRSANFSAVATQAFAGTRSGEVRVPTGDHYGGAMDFDFTSAGLAEPEEIYLRYYVRFNDTWQRNGDGQIGKLPGFGGNYDSGVGQGCKPVNGTDAWSARMASYDRGSTNTVAFYVYHADMAEDCGDILEWPQQLQRNRWYSIEARVKLNTITNGRGNRDGILEGWIDDKLVLSRKDLRFRDTPALKIERIWGNVYVGGSWTADRNMSIHFDNLVVARGRIGAAGAAPVVDTTPPVRPSGLKAY